MKRVHIITDSTSDISQHEAAKLGIDVVPMHVNIDGVDYIDGLTINNQDFLKSSEPQRFCQKPQLLVLDRFLTLSTNIQRMKKY